MIIARGRLSFPKLLCRTSLLFYYLCFFALIVPCHLFFAVKGSHPPAQVLAHVMSESKGFVPTVF